MTADSNSSDETGHPASRQADTSQFVEFQIQGRRYAFPIEQIREIVILKDVTPTPHVAACVDGVSNLRGAIIPIVNLRALFGLDRVEADDETRTIVVNVGQRTIGCTVDAVTQVLRIADDEVQPAPEMLTSDGAEYITGFVKVEDQLVIILNVDQLLDVEKLHHVHQANVPGMIPNGS